MTFRIEDHALGDLHEVETFYAAPMLGAECACHNPDESGEGRVDFTGSTLAEIAFAWLAHIESLDLLPVPGPQAVAFGTGPLITFDGN